MTNPTVTTYKPVITGATTATVSGQVWGDGVTPAHVQSTQNSSAASAASVAVAYSSNVTSGNLLVVATGLGSSTNTVTISDSKGNSWNQANVSTQASIPYRIYVHYAVANSSGANTVTLTPSASTANLRLLIHEYSGVDAFDVTAQAAAASGVIDTGLAQTTKPGELIFGWGINNTGTTVADPGFTLRQTALSESTVDQFVTKIDNYKVTYPTDATANCGIMATFGKASVVTERGIVYNTSGTPTTADTKVTNSSDIGLFSNNMTGLTDGTTYYVRAYAINANGTAYGQEYSFRNMKANTVWIDA